MFEQNQIFAVKSTESKTQSQQSTSQLYETERKQSIIPLKFCEILLVSYNLINFCKISQFLVKFGKSLKDFRENIVEMTWKNSQILALFC